MRIAIIENEEVVNVIVGDAIPKNGIECDEIVCVGWSYINKKFVAPPLNVKEDEVTE